MLACNPPRRLPPSNSVIDRTQCGLLRCWLLPLSALIQRAGKLKQQTKGNQVMKTSYIGSVIIGFISLLTCGAQATCIDVNSLPGDGTAVFVISQPGSYCLGDNVVGVSGKNGIRIDADNVTLDLAGFGVLGVGGSLSGILINNHIHIAIRNGSISGWGGAGLEGTAGALARIDDLRADVNVGNGIVIN